MESNANPINPVQRLRDAPRCRAKAKSTGQGCKAPAVNGWRVCRVHGAGGGAPCGAEHPNYRHGGRTREFEAVRRMGVELVRMARDSVKALPS